MSVQPSALATIVAIMLLHPVPAQAQGAAPPDVVTRGLAAFRAMGARAALPILLKDSPAAGDPRSVSSTVEALDQVREALGAMQGHDVLRVSQLGAHTSRTYVVLLFERGPIYAYFDCYLTKNGWIVSSFQYNGKPEVILPEFLLSR